MAESKVAAMTRGTMTKACVLALLLFARGATGQGIQTAAQAAGSPAQTPSAPPAAEKAPPAPPKISYVGGQLRIDALDSTLAEVLTKVAALTGVKIDIPPGADSERMPVVELGPGPARQILASLLSDSNFDYMIQASDTDPEKIRMVLLMPRERKGGGSKAIEAAARPSRSPYGRAAAPARPEPASVPDSPVAAPPESAATEAISLEPPTQPEQPTPPPPVQPAPPVLSPLLQSDSSSSTRPGSLAPPQDLSSRGISQQLQQMYQQRMQMTQQDRYTGTQPVPAIPGAK